MPDSSVEINKTIRQWDAFAIFIFTGLLTLSTFLCRTWFDEIKEQVRELNSSRDSAAVEVARVKAQTEAQWHESERRFDSIEKKIDLLLDRPR